MVLHVMSACGVLIRRLVDDSMLLLNQFATVNLSCSLDKNKECLEFARKQGVKSDCDGICFG
jgi:hypothetical protein